MASGERGEPPEDLTAAELGMWQAFRNGTRYDLSAGDADLDDPHSALLWGAQRSVRARVVCRLLLDGPAPLPGRVASLKLAGVRLTGSLDLAGGRVEPYVELVRCRFDQEVLLPESRFTTLRLVDCAIPRLEAARLTTDGDLHLPRCRIRSGVRLSDAHIGTDLLLDQLVAHRDRRGRSLLGDGMTVGQDLQAELLESFGELSLRGAQIGGSFSLRGSVLRNPYGRRALNAPQLTVGRTLYLTAAASGSSVTTGATPLFGSMNTPARGTRVRPFECRGGVRLDDGRFGDSVDLEQARFVLADEQQVSLRRIQAPELRFLCERPERGTVVLSGARVGVLVDRLSSWPGPGGLEISGFGYETLVPRGPFTLADRLGWVTDATPEYAPEPYERLAAVLRAQGEDSDARAVLLTKQRRRRETLPPAARLWGYVQDLTVAYGYKPGRAALWMALLWAAGAAALAARFGPGGPPPLKPGENPGWNPPLYALDLLVPVIDLGQQGHWRLSTAWQWAAAFLIVLGWLLATAVAAGASRLLRKG
ncbi:oxidoreductase [Streptomyces sp. NPDC060194]|uniref:oxidoreductase n=1 Tax=Streptomyces sp. NPDC060194 TaxID=3347069 RepID=UPI003665CF42